MKETSNGERKEPQLKEPLGGNQKGWNAGEIRRNLKDGPPFEVPIRERNGRKMVKRGTL